MKRAKKIPSGKKAGRARKRGVLILMSGVVVLLVSACGLSARLEEETVPWAELKASVPAAPDDPEEENNAWEQPDPAAPGVSPENPDEPEEPGGAEPKEPEDPVAPEDPEDWALLLVNPWTPMPEGYQVELTELKNHQSVDRRCYPDLQKMMDDCRAAGLEPLICSSYRTWEKQERLYQNKIQRLIDAGMDSAKAPEEAGKVVAVPGTSEHQLGLAVDIVDTNYQILDEAQENTAVQKWLMEHSWEYGFILRYPSDKGHITGIIYEPWHYRYVGREAAREMYEQGLCMEEYVRGADSQEQQSA